MGAVASLSHSLSFRVQQASTILPTFLTYDLILHTLVNLDAL